MNLGIIGCSEIAYRRFMPAAKCLKDVSVIAVAEEYDTRKLNKFCNDYQIEGMDSFISLIQRDDIDAVYVPQPPALHYKWAKEALLHGKHVLIEKPSTISFELTKDLVETAKRNNLALHENYMFQYHSQISAIRKLINNGEIGDIRLYRTSFGFPLRASNDFRYIKELGGGALLDAGGYTLKLASILLGDSVKINSATLSYIEGYEVDMFGNAQLSNELGQVCQISFGMDCFYKCSLEVWGSKGFLSTDRIFTAPEDYEPTVNIFKANNSQIIQLPSDNHFVHSIENFIKETIDDVQRNNMYNEILLQSSLVENFRNNLPSYS